MRILHLSTSDVLGAYSAAYRVHKACIENRHDSLMWVAKKTRNDHSVVGPSIPVAVIWRLLRTLMAIFRRLVFVDKSRTKFAPSFDMSLVPLNHYVKRSGSFKPDLIILYCINDFASLESVSDLAKRWSCKVAIYHMDMGLMTGSCHYAWECVRYKSIDACSQCSMEVRALSFKRLVKMSWRRKNEALKTIKPIVFCGSNQLLLQSRSSNLLSSLKHYTLLMSVDPERFKPLSKSKVFETRSKLGLMNDTKVVFFGAQSLDDPRKGFRYFEQALLKLSDSAVKQLRHGLTILLVGKSADRIKKNPSLNYVCLDFVTDQELFANIYASVDVMVCSSVEDSGPMMINEAMMSGLPVIAFNNGVAPDLVNVETGWLVEPKNSDHLKEALENFIKLNLNAANKMRNNCRELALNNCTPAAQITTILKSLADAQIGSNSL
jgi:glycosyltransferase involved in cell wall biosynthesis